MSSSRRLRVDSETLVKNDSMSGSINTSNKLFVTPTHSRSPSVRTEFNTLICKDHNSRYEDLSKLAHSTSLNDLRRANSVRSNASYHYSTRDGSSSLKRTRSANKSQRFRRTQSYYAPSQSRRRSQKRHVSTNNSQPPTTNNSGLLLEDNDEQELSYFGLLPPSSVAKEPIEPEAVQQMQVTLVREAKERRRRVIVTSVIVTFCLLLLFSVLAVLVTLTHRSEITVGNETIPYYTFSPSLPVVIMREQNRDMLKSLQREPATTTIQPPPNIGALSQQETQHQQPLQPEQQQLTTVAAAAVAAAAAAQA